MKKIARENRQQKYLRVMADGDRWSLVRLIAAGGGNWSQGRQTAWRLSSLGQIAVTHQGPGNSCASYQISRSGLRVLSDADGVTESFAAEIMGESTVAHAQRTVPKWVFALGAM